MVWFFGLRLFGLRRIGLRRIGEVALRRVDCYCYVEWTGMLTRTHRYGDRWRAISVDLHSCGLSAEVWRTVEVS